MFTNNWYAAISTVITNNSNFRERFKTYTGAVPNPSTWDMGSVRNFLALGVNTEHQAIPSIEKLRSRTSGSNGGVIMGDGNAPESVSDYKLSGKILNLTSTSVKKTEILESGSKMTVTHTVANNGASEVTVSEVGLFAHSGYNTSSDSILLERTVLDTPVTIPGNGGIGQVVYTITISNNYPGAPV